MTAPPLFYYRKAVPHSVFPGAHPGKIVGSGQLFKHHTSLIASPDPRQLDLRASVLNPFEQLLVKNFQQQSRLDVFLVADLSASMAYHGQYNKQQVVVDCLLSIAESAHAMGDRFGFVGCGQSIDRKLLISPANLQHGQVNELARTVKKISLKGRAESLLQATNYLPSRSSLVFLLSDFYMPMLKIQQQMQTLNQHTVVPLVLWDQKEAADLPRWGIVKFADMEQGTTRTLFMRPALQQKIMHKLEQRKQQLRHCFRAYGGEPLFIEKGYRAEALSQYFLQHVA